MAVTQNLSITKIDSNTSQAGVVANTAFDVLDAALSEITITLSDSNYTLSSSTTPKEWHYGVVRVTGALTAARQIVVPTNKKLYVLVNATTGGFGVTLKTPSGTGITVAPGASVLLRCDGTNVVRANPNRAAVSEVTYAASVEANFTHADTVRVTLAGNVSITLAGALDGQRCTLEVIQDAIGGRTVSFGAQVRFGSDITSFSPSTGGDKLDRIAFIYNAAANKYDVVAVQRGY